MSTRRGVGLLLCALCIAALGWFGGRNTSGSPSRRESVREEEMQPIRRRVRVEDDDAHVAEQHHQYRPDGHDRATTIKTAASALPVSPPATGEAIAPTSTCPAWNRTVDGIPTDFDAATFCRAFNESARRHPVRVWYGMMFSFELDMLEVVLHETSMVVDKYVIVESQASHSKKQKPLFLSQVWEQERFRPFLPKIINGTFVARRSFRSGWDYEKRQRKRVLQVVQASGIRDGDLFIANLDLDEVFSRKTVMRYKFCSTANPGFHSFGFRYYLNCLQDESVAFFQRSIIYWLTRDVPFYDLYRARTARIQININISDVRQAVRQFDSQLVWHMSTFGSFEEIRFKQSHSPHRFVDGNDDAVAKYEIEHCIYNNRTRYFIELYPDMLPNFIARNLCRFKELGWVRSSRE